MVVEHTILKLKNGTGRAYQEPQPIPYIFIESVLDSNVMSEGGLGELFKTGVAKLKAALTPGPSGDLETLLTFMAPSSGGLQQINQLIQQASKAEGSLLDPANSAWWEELYGAFGVNDQETKTAVQQQVQQDLLNPQPEEQPEEQADPTGQEGTNTGAGGGKQAAVQHRLQMLIKRMQELKAKAQPEPAQPEPAQPEPAQPEPAQPVAKELTKKEIHDHIARLRKLNREGNLSQEGQETLTQLINQRNAPADDEEHLNKKQIIMPGDTQHSMPENRIVAELALSLLTERCVRNNIGIIANLMLRKIGSPQSVRMPLISEAGLVSKLKDAIGGIPNKLSRMANTATDMVSNPQYAQQQLAASGASSNNERAAKQAVRILTDNLRGQFESKLSANGLTPDQIQTTLASWQKLRPQAERGEEKALQQYNIAAETLKKAFKLFNVADGSEPDDYSSVTGGFESLEPVGAPGSGTQISGVQPAKYGFEEQGIPATYLTGGMTMEQTAQLQAILAHDRLDVNQSLIVWRLITGRSPDMDKFRAAIQKTGNSIPKPKLIKAAKNTADKIRAANYDRDNPVTGF